MSEDIKIARGHAVCTWLTPRTLLSRGVTCALVICLSASAHSSSESDISNADFDWRSEWAVAPGFTIERDTEGFTQTSVKKQGWWCSDTASLYFDNCRVPAGNLLGEEHKGFMAAMRNFNAERLGMAATALGASKLCRDYAWKYGTERYTFGKPLTQHQVIRHKLVEMTARINTVQSYLEKIAWRMNQGEMPVADVSMLKVQATTMMEFCAREASQILGGASYMRDNPVERIYREVRVMAIGGGSEEILRDLAARQLGI